MRIPPTLIGLVYVVGGFIFAVQSSPNWGTDTHWGFAITGVTCLVLGAKFLGMPQNRDALMKKAGRPDPLD